MVKLYGRTAWAGQFSVGSVGGSALTFLKRYHKKRVMNFNLFRGLKKNRCKSIQAFKIFLYLFCSFCAKRFNFVILFRDLKQKRITTHITAPFIACPMPASQARSIPSAILIKKFLLHGYNAGRLVLY